MTLNHTWHKALQKYSAVLHSWIHSREGLVARRVHPPKGSIAVPHTIPPQGCVYYNTFHPLTQFLVPCNPTPVCY